MNRKHSFLINGLIGIMCFFLLGCSIEKEVPYNEASVQVPKEQKMQEKDTKEKDKKEQDKGETNLTSDSKTKVPKQQLTEQATTEEPEKSLARLHVEGTQLVDEENNPIQLKGLSTHGLSWFPQYVNQELFEELSVEWNCNVVRLAMYSAEYNGYCTGGNQKELKQLIKDGVNYAEKAKMYVIVDWHVLGEGNPNIYIEEAKAFFEEMSKEFADKNHVIYEICNEPNGGVSWSEVKAYAMEVIPIIRANDEDAIIIVGTPTWSQDVDKAAADPIDDYDNIMYALHFYAATHKDDLRNKMVRAIDSGLPVIVSEYGICSADGNGGIDKQQAQTWIDLMNERNISYIAWNLSNKNETSAVFSSGCAKVSGFTENDLSESGRFLYQMLNSKSSISQVTEEKTNEEPKEVVPPNHDMNLEYYAEISNSWETDGKLYEQYAVTLQNVSSNEINGWEIEIDFPKEFEISDSWNGNYSVKGKKMIITNVDYNAVIAPNMKAKDIGFIICY